MKSNRLLVSFLATALIAGCGGGGTAPAPASSSNGSGSNGGTGTGSGTGTGTGGTPSAANVLSITVNDPTYPNKPTVSVTVCAPGSTTNCRTIDNILLDTGSYGLRVFRQALGSVSLTPVTVNSNPVAECMVYVDNTGDWGPVQLADVTLGRETSSNVPIQVIDATYFSSALPTACTSPNVTTLDSDPGTAGYNGILGVGLFASDCGAGCSGSANTNNGYYFTCSGTSCPGTAVPVASQVTNPVAMLQKDNNGVVMQLPAVALGGVASTSGQLILGIGTQSNNTPAGATVYPASPDVGEFTTTFNGVSLSNSFIDSGSNGLFFNAPSSLIAGCVGGNTGWYCPPAIASLTATNKGYGSATGVLAAFMIGNADSLFSSTTNSAFAELGGTSPAGSGFDWGLPFFFNKTIYVGIENTTSSLGTGPYWAY
jgi:hypothetical protein